MTSGLRSIPLTAYSHKPPSYFGGARCDWVAELPTCATARVLEVGCGDGVTGAMALASGKCAWYAGVELCEGPASNARGRLSEVVEGDAAIVELPWEPATFDCLFLSEVLEHLGDPWQVLRRLRPLLARGARVFASSPNACHYRIICMLLRGEWRWEPSGPLDKTHLRWFTPSSYRDLFQSTGFVVDRVFGHTQPRWKQRLASAATFGRVDHLLYCQTELRAHV